MVLAIAGSAVGGSLLLVVTFGVLLCTLIIKLKRHSAADKSQSKLHDQLFIQHEVGNASISHTLCGSRLPVTIDIYAVTSIRPRGSFFCWFLSHICSFLEQSAIDWLLPTPTYQHGTNKFVRDMCSFLDKFHQKVVPKFGVLYHVACLRSKINTGES